MFFFYFWFGKDNKTLNDWVSGKQCVLFSLDTHLRSICSIERLVEAKLTVSLGVCHKSFTKFLTVRKWFSNLFKYLETILSACLAHTSLTGLLPWYAGLMLGFGGRGPRIWYGMAVYDSIAWLWRTREISQEIVCCFALLHSLGNRAKICWGTVSAKLQYTRKLCKP